MGTHLVGVGSWLLGAGKYKTDAIESTVVKWLGCLKK